MLVAKRLQQDKYQKMVRLLLLPSLKEEIKELQVMYLSGINGTKKTQLVKTRTELLKLVQSL